MVDSHPNCRCAKVPYKSEDEEKSDSTKRKAFLAEAVSASSNKLGDKDNLDDEPDNVDDLEEEMNYNGDGSNRWGNT